MPRLFTYTIPFDDGAAPNPFNGMCTLAICKPGIRRVAQVGDWVAGLGSKNSPQGDLSNRLVYAMRVEKVVTLKEYDELAPLMWPHRKPVSGSLLANGHLGDCIYDYSSAAVRPEQRAGVHGIGNIDSDLSGRNVLISTDYYYFGSSAEPLPQDLDQIVHQTQGHKSTANAPCFDKFVAWIRTLEYARGQFGQPGTKLTADPKSVCSGCFIREEDALNDVECTSGAYLATGQG